MAPSKTPAFRNSKGAGSQAAFFKGQIVYSTPMFSESFFEDIPLSETPSEQQKPQPIAKFGFSDDGGRYELLLSAISRGRLSMTKTLISVLPAMSVRDAILPTGENSIMTALKFIEDDKKRKMMVDFLIENGANVTFVNPVTGESLLHFCASRVPRLFPEFNDFLSRSAIKIDLSKPDINGNNVLHCAVTTRHIPTIVLLLRVAYREFTDMDKPNYKNLSPYLLAHKLGYYEIANLIDRVAVEGTSVLNEYYEENAQEDEARRSARGNGNLMFPAFPNNGLPSRFDNFQLPIRNRTAVRREGDEERLLQKLNETLKKRESVIIAGQPRRLPSIPLPSAVIRRRKEEQIEQSRSLHNIQETLALLPHYAITHHQNMIFNTNSVDILRRDSTTQSKSGERRSTMKSQ